MGQVLYRKYRSKSLDQIIGQDHITNILSNALEKNKLSHAYLFTGPRGVGKTSIARILAHQINGLKYEDKNYLDIIEIDAASNRKIDEIRDLREKVNLLPAQAKYKIYIIDEVHMLTKEAFNALLKTLEEPPKHVIFILATTDFYKLPLTIVSRTQHFSFRPIPNELIFKHLKDIAKKEDIDIEDEALKIIAEHGQGSFRDSISLLDQFSSSNEKITKERILDSLGLPDEKEIQEIIFILNDPKSDYEDLSNKLRSLFSLGLESKLIAKKLLNALRIQFLDNKTTLPKKTLFKLLDNLILVDSSPDPDSFLELILLEAKNVVSPYEETNKDLKIPKEIKPKVVLARKKTITKEEPIVKQENLWDSFLEKIKPKYNTLYGILKNAHYNFKDNILTIKVTYPFHQKQISNPTNQKVILDNLFLLSKHEYTLKIKVKKEQKQKEQSEEPSIQKINDIFGNSELVES